MTLYILEYNNYYNRLVKKEESLEDYQPYIIYDLLNTNFNPSDKVNTQHTFGVGDYDGKGDYLIAVDDDGTINSRWFIIQADRTRAGQYQLSLHRDLVVDYYNLIKESPMFIEKAILKDNDPMIFNQEEMTFNQIKQSETLLKDKTGVSWVVMYLAHNQGLDTEVNVTPSGTADITGYTRETWQFSDGYKIASSNNAYYNFNCSMKVKDGSFLNVNFNRIGENGGVNYNSNTKTSSYWVYSPKSSNYSGDDFYDENNDTFNSILNSIPLWANINVDESLAQSMNALNGNTIIFDGENTKYKIEVSSELKQYQKGYSSQSIGIGDIVFQELANKWSSWIKASNEYNRQGTFYEYNLQYTEYTMKLIPVGTTNAQIVYPAMVNRQILKDAPYDMICFPYETTQIKLDNNNTIITQYTEDVMTVVNSIIEKNAGASPIVYDVQRLPYCPLSQIYRDNNTNILDVSMYDNKYTYTKGGNVAGVILQCEVSNFQGTIPFDNSLTSIDNAKIQTLTDMYRLCSPNYNGMFEFDIVMNGGLNGFNFYCTYKPYNPYIQVSPLFGGLYGKNFGDARGLICGGDFSLPIVTDAWSTYERQNKNYQNIFDRQIENMRVNNKYQRIQDITGAIVGTIAGGATGGAAGAMYGGGIGAGIGAGVGTLLSAVGGVSDYAIKEKLRYEALDYTKDQFGYQLGNIQALPDSLAKTSAFNISNKIFPFLEYYTCTKEEKIALANKIAYNGMTVMRIGTISEFVDNIWQYEDIKAKNYIKGKLIRLENTNEDYHIINSISNELNQGVYIK